MKALKKLKGIGSRFDLNGCTERLLSRPTDRKGKIEMTMGGKAEHSTVMSLIQFEDQTGYYIEGLEPVITYNYNSVISQFKKDLTARDMTLSKGDEYYLVGGDMTFTTRNNVKSNVSIFLSRTDKGYKVSAGRGANWHLTHKEEFEAGKESLPFLLICGLAHVDKLSTTKLQVLSKLCLNNEDDREKIDGIPKLFENESIEKYFYRQEMPAGVVINQKNRFQVFTSTLIGEKMSFHYVTKDYKTLKGAEKYLGGMGYNLIGKQLPVLNIKELEENTRKYMRDTRFSTSYSDNSLTILSAAGGEIDISSVKLRENERLGSEYYVNAQYMSEKDGRTVSQEIIVDARVCGGQVGRLYTDIFNFTAAIRKAYTEQTLNFDNDNRNENELKKYHEGQIKNLIKNKEHTEKSIKEHAEDERYVSNRKEAIFEYDTKINQHENALSLIQ